MSKEQKNEGEGNRTAARRYTNATERFVDSGQVKQQGKKAREALQGQEREALSQAEKVGREKAGQYRKNDR